jgi:hypothetical protein
LYYLEVLPLGSKQALSNGNEPEELTAMLCAFEKSNKVVISIHANTVLRKEKADTLYVANAMPEEGEGTAAKYLGSASALCWGSEYKNLVGLFTSLLYKLDFQLAELEWGKVRERR